MPLRRELCLRLPDDPLRFAYSVREVIQLALALEYIGVEHNTLIIDPVHLAGELVLVEGFAVADPVPVYRVEV